MNTKATKEDLERAEEELEKATRLVNSLGSLIEALKATQIKTLKRKSDKSNYLFLYTPREVEYTFIYVPGRGRGDCYCDLRKEGEEEGNYFEIDLMCRTVKADNIWDFVGVKDNKDAKRHNGDKVIVSFPGDGTLSVRWKK